MKTVPAKRVADSQVELNFFMMVEHANLYGNVHGGVIMKLVDEAVRCAPCGMPNVLP